MNDLEHGIAGLLHQFANEQAQPIAPTGDATVLLLTGGKVTGIVQSAADGYVTISRRTGPDEYADIPRHFAIAAVAGAYYVEGS